MSDIESTNWQIRLRNAKECAQNGEEGDVTFLQASRKPLVSLFIKTGGLTPNGHTKRSVELNFVSQHSRYPQLLEDIKDIELKGYELYKLTTTNEISLEDYKLLFYSTCNNIENAISKYNGVVCYKDGNSDNNEITNLYILHICDIMNLMTNSHKNLGTDVTVRSNLLKEFNGKKVVNLFEKNTYI